MNTAQSPRIVRFGSFEADLHTRELRKHGLKPKVQEQPFQVLALLLARPGELVTRRKSVQDFGHRTPSLISITD